MKTVGTASVDFLGGLLNQLVDAGSQGSEVDTYLPRSVQRMTAIAAMPSRAKPPISGKTVPS